MKSDFEINLFSVCSYPMTYSGNDVDGFTATDSQAFDSPDSYLDSGYSVSIRVPDKKYYLTRLSVTTSNVDRIQIDVCDHPFNVGHLDIINHI